MRKPRKTKENAVYHVIARANAREHLLASPAAKALFLLVLIQAKDKYDFDVINFIVMNNHVHLMMKPLGKQGDLSKIMQWILGVYAIRYNKMTGRCGHFWQDRFKSKIVNSMAYFIKLFEYIAYNAVKAKIADSIFSYPFSGIYHIMRGWFQIVQKPTKFLYNLFPYLAIKP